MFGQKTALLATLQGDRIWISIVLLNPRIRVSTTKLLNSVYAMVTYGIGVEFQRARGTKRRGFRSKIVITHRRTTHERLKVPPNAADGLVVS